MLKPLQNIVTTYNSYKAVILSRVPNIKFPEKLKGTIVERWKNYWIQVMQDYSEVGREALTSAKNEPVRAAALASLFSFGVYCFKTNPNEVSYRDTVLSYGSELILVGPTVRNPAAKKYLEEIETLYNEGVVKRLSLGLFSLILKDDYNDTVSVYKAQCTYLKVPFYNSHKQIVDVGFMNKWHILEKRMIDYDINPEEWPSEDDRAK